MKTKLLYLFTIALLLTFSSCSKNELCPDSEKAEIADHTSFDGCGVLIELKDGTILEPMNLKDFDINKKNGTKVWIKYHDATNAGSVCMMGEMVEIDCIIER